MKFKTKFVLKLIFAWSGTFAFLLLCWWMVFCLSSCKPQSLKDGDVIVCIGDSITASGSWEGGWVARVQNAIEAEGLKVKVINSGVAGNTSKDVLARIDSPLSQKPTICILFVGVNDCWRMINENTIGTTIPNFHDNILSIVNILKSHSKVILLTPLCIGEAAGGVPLLDDYSDQVIKVAVDEGVQLINMRHEFKKRLKDVTVDKGTLTVDGIHPNIAGSILIAHMVMKGLLL